MRRMLIFLGGLLVLVSVGGCDRIYGLLQKEGAEEKALVGQVVPFEKNVKVEKVQRLLKLYGYRIGKADGVLGANTRQAIENFQTDNNLPVTRFVDQATWAELNRFVEDGLVVKNAINMRAVQQALANAGFDPGSADGRAGVRTQAALAQFQQAAHLKPDGRIGFQTLRRLANYLPQSHPPALSKKRR